MIRTLVVFGAAGDLAGRLLLPALAALRTSGSSGASGASVQVVGAGPQDWTTQHFARHVRARLAQHAAGVAGVAGPDVDGLVGASTYRQADVGDPAAVAAVLDVARAARPSEPIAVYLALPTQVMPDAVRSVAAAGLPAGSRIAVEKPFGHDAASAAELNTLLSGVEGVYRVDHALAMPALARPAVRQQASTVEQVELLWEETLALEGRASFYDRAGALRDVLQNHLVQLLCTIAAEPGDPAEAGVRRADALRAVRPLDPAAVRTQTRRARYTAGRLADGRDVPDYAAEDGVDPARDTETFAEVVLQLDTPRWRGTRFVLRAGKALAERRRGMLVRPHGADPVWIDVDDGPDAEAAAYRRVVSDLLTGGSQFAVGAQEVELAWQVLTPVLDGWAADLVPLTSYPAGSNSPVR